MAQGVSCCICYDDAPLGITCAANHATCDDCLEQYVVNKVTDLSKQAGLAAEAETAALARDEGRLAALGGGCFCPLHGQGGCEAARPFPDRDIAAHVSADGFEKYVLGKTLLPVARKVQEVTGCPRARCPLMCLCAEPSRFTCVLWQVMQKKHELSLLFPDARQCGSCGAGPVMLAGCTDLTTHHGQVMSGPRGAQGGQADRPPVDNSCRRCALHPPCTLTAPSLHPPCTLPAPSLHSPCAAPATALHPPRAHPAPSLHSTHPPCTLAVLFFHPPCTRPAPSLHALRYRCGWFVRDISQWPAWDPTAAALGADGQQQASTKLVRDGFALAFLIVVTVALTLTLTRPPSEMRTPTRLR